MHRHESALSPFQSNPCCYQRTGRIRGSLGTSGAVPVVSSSGAGSTKFIAPLISPLRLPCNRAGLGRSQNTNQQIARGRSESFSVDTRLDFKANVAARHKTLLLLDGGSEVCATRTSSGWPTQGFWQWRLCFQSYFKQRFLLLLLFCFLSVCFCCFSF